MRRSHYLKHNRATEIPTQFIFVDTETKGEQISIGREKHTLWFGWACYLRFRLEGGTETPTEDWFRFETPEAFWKWVVSHTRSGSKCYIFAHNWNFDGAILATQTILRALGFETLQYINEKPPFILRVKRKKQYLALIDTLNYFAMPLAKLGEELGFPKDTMPEDTDSVDDWDVYCRRDVAVLIHAVLKFRSLVIDNDLGAFRPTLASQAFTAYRHRFMPEQILIHDDEETLALERASYYGGRVECFHIGELRRKLYYLDVNSLYPYIMRENEFPTRLKWTDDAPTLSTLAAAVEESAVVARVTLDTETPAFPFRHKAKLTFPIGRFQTVLSTPEISYALEIGAVAEVQEMAGYETGKLFVDYVDTLYALRQGYKQEGNSAFDFLCKIMLNSLYGKFGQKGGHWEEIRDATDADPLEWLGQETEDSPVVKHRVRLGKVQRLNRDIEASESFPAIAAHVTSYARRYMWSLIEQAGRENVYYTDTDSLVVNAQGRRRLASVVDSHALGRLKLENTTTRAIFYGAKDYRFGDTQRTKGIRHNATQIDDATWEQVRFWSWDAHLKAGDDGFIYIDTIQKHLKRQYDKGIVTESGKVEPLRFPLETALADGG